MRIEDALSPDLGTAEIGLACPSGPARGLPKRRRIAVRSEPRFDREPPAPRTRGHETPVLHAQRNIGPGTLDQNIRAFSERYRNEAQSGERKRNEFAPSFEQAQRDRASREKERRSERQDWNGAGGTWQAAHPIRNQEDKTEAFIHQAQSRASRPSGMSSAAASAIGMTMIDTTGSASRLASRL